MPHGAPAMSSSAMDASCARATSGPKCISSIT
jgi:hypothetical protein